jgi:hypothetical protein
MKSEKLLAIYDGLQVVRGEVNIAGSTHQSWSTILLFKYKTKFFTPSFLCAIVYQLITTDRTSPRQGKTPMSPSDIESTSIRLSQ